MAISTPNELFVHELENIYSAEQVFLRNMQDMHRMAHNSNLKQMLQQHISGATEQVKNLDNAFRELGQQPQHIKCEGAEGIVNEFKTTARQVQNPQLLDLAILGAWEKGEVYEMATYRGLVEKAQMMGKSTLAQVLQRNLSDELSTLQEIAETGKDIESQVIRGSQGQAAA